jgi:Anti-sigma-D factor RsdA to sigma factor binding region
MPDFSRWGANGGDPSLNAIARTDRYLDALSSEQPVYATDPADAELANLMAGWRDGVRRPPTRVGAQRDAEIVLRRALATRRRTRMSMGAIGSVAAALLCLGGFGAVVYGAGPGDALYGLRVALFGEQQVTRDDKVALAAQTEMQQVQQLIDQGNWDAAQDKLKAVTSTVQTVEDPQRQQDLQQQLNQLSVKVQTHDPDATVPEAAPVSPPPGDQPLPGISLPPGLSLPSLPGSGGPLPGIPGGPLPGIPGISLPSLPDLPDLPLPGPGVPPNISLPPLPKPLPEGPKPVPGDAKPAPKPAPDDPKPAEPQTAPDAHKPAQELPKPVDPPKPLIPDVIPVPKPGPAPEAPPPMQEAPPAPVIPVVPAPKAPSAQAPAPQDEPSVENSTTLFPIPAQKPPKGGN